VLGKGTYLGLNTGIQRRVQRWREQSTSRKRREVELEVEIENFGPISSGKIRLKTPNNLHRPQQLWKVLHRDAYPLHI